MKKWATVAIPRPMTITIINIRYIDLYFGTEFCFSNDRRLFIEETFVIFYEVSKSSDVDFLMSLILFKLI